jgi:hypothetical protein
MTDRQQNDRFKDYVGVAERVTEFYEKYPEGRILTEIVEHDRDAGFILMRAEVYRGSLADMAAESAAAVGHAYESRDAGYVQKTSYVEVCETSAVGRALANLGFETKRATGQQKSQPAAARPAQASDEQRERADMVREIEASAKRLGYSSAQLNSTCAKKFDGKKLSELTLDQMIEVRDGLHALERESKKA